MRFSSSDLPAGLRQIGCFHFASAGDNPFDCLMAALNGQNIKDSLIVLPEAFDLRGGYYRGDHRIDESLIVNLNYLAASRDAAFVLSVAEGTGPNPDSTAYLVDGLHEPAFLSQKIPKSKLICEARIEVARYRKRGVTALICDNASPDRDDDVKAMKTKLRSVGVDILCIPAAMSSTSSQNVTALWSRDFTVALANGHPAYPSVLASPDEPSVISPDKTIDHFLWKTLNPG